MNKKKIIFYYINVLPSQGGQWFYALYQLEFLKKEILNNFDIRVLVTNKRVQECLTKNNIHSKFLSISFLEKIYLKIVNHITFLNDYLNFKTSFEKQLISMNCALLYVPHLFFLSKLVQKIPTIATVLDLCHLDFPKLKEFLNNDDINQRETFLNRYAKKNFLIIAESEDTKKKLIDRYKVTKENILVKYFDISKNITINKQVEVSILKNKKFFFYPSNFLSHKNHKLIIDAHEYLHDKDLIYVFSGNDRGHLDEIKSLINDKKLKNNFFIFENLDYEKMNYLYKNCFAIIYPSFFGPANIPLFEAWYLKKPILYPEQFNNFSKNGAILFDNTNPKSLAKSINLIEETNKNKKIIEDGYKTYLDYRNLDKDFIKDLITKLNNF